MFYLRKIFNIFILYLIFISNAISYIFIDIDECTLPSGRGIRVATFDTDAQKFHSVNYFTSLNPSQEGWMATDNWGICYSHSGNVFLPDNFNLTNFIIRTRGNFVNNKIGPYDTSDGKHLLRQRIWGVKTTPELPKTIYDKFRAFSFLPKGNFQVIVDGFTGTEKQIPGNTHAQGKERGKLGELATDMTFLSFDYSKLPSQNGSNHGLDGVYVDNIYKPLTLFLTESKYRSESKSAEAYMIDEFNEEEICRKIETAHPETKNIIKSFIEHKPFEIHKLIHRMSGGGSQMCIQPFDLTSYRSFRLKNPTFFLSEEDTMAILEGLMERMELTAQTHQEINVEHRSLLGRAKVKLNHFIDGDSRELLEINFRDLPPKEIEKVKNKLKEVPEDKRQMVFDIVFRSILGYAANSTYILKNEILSTIESISRSVAAIPSDQFLHVDTVADTIFGSEYFDVDSDHFELEDRLSIFHSFMNSSYGHFIDNENRDDLLYLYHIIYNSLRAIEIESEEIQDQAYLTRFVQNLRTIPEDDFKNICCTIQDIYNSEGYAYLKGVHDCEDWELLAKELRGLNEKQRKRISNFLSWLPDTFDCGPADAVKIFKDKSWLERINKLKSFEELGELAKRAFQIHEDQDKQLDSLDLIITYLINKISHKQIIREIKML